MSRTNEARFMDCHETCKCSVNLEKMFVIISNVGIKINIDVNVKN